VPPFEAATLATAAGGSLVRGDPAATIDSFSIDTRTLRKGGAFFALKGEHADGHDFLGDAARAGAAAVVVERDPPDGGAGLPVVIRVDGVADALARAGAAARAALVRTTIVAVTGSAGKTTTKELIAAGLAAGGRRAYRSPGNFNNHLGVPLGLLNAPEDSDFAVIEMGMSAAGEIAALMRIANPDVALVTNIRPVHLEFFGSLDDIAAAKGEMYALLRGSGVAVVNLDDERCRIQAARHSGARVTFGRNSAADFVLVSVRDGFLPGVSFAFRHAGAERTMSLKLFGVHSAMNALAALATVRACGGDVDAAGKVMADVEPVAGRGTVFRLNGEMLLVDDTYNSNPAALASVLETLRASRPKGRRVLVMGDMLELGPEEHALHRAAGERAGACGVEMLIGVGPRSRGAVEAARRAKVPETYHEPDAAAAARSVPSRVKAGDLVVVKGSRGIHLEQVVEALRRDPGEAR
jgi:UDP-N-acetylmuramoyl-tripeptide--D-alanyl-D-alanine ligase